jgi:hypothetical protein
MSSLLLGSNLVSFHSNITTSVRDDIKDCLLLAQLRASEQFCSEQYWPQWADAYRRTLISVGSNLTEVIDRSPVKVKKQKYFQGEAAKLVASMPSPSLAIAANDALAAMYRSDHAKNFYKSWFSSGRSESFQIIPCEKNVSGSIDIMLCGLQMVTRTKVSTVRPLFIPIWPFSYELTLLLKGGKFLFSEASYYPHRESVRAELRQRGAQGIKSIELRASLTESDNPAPR